MSTSGPKRAVITKRKQTVPISPGYAWDVILTLVQRELSVRYKGSVLGLMWAVLSPLGTVAVLWVLFSRVLDLGIPHYAAFIYAGLLPWTWFQTALLTSSAILIDHRDLVRKPFFPRPLLPGVVTMSNFVLYLLALPVLLVLLLVDGIPVTGAITLLPLVWLVQGVFTLACAMAIAALGVLVRDVQHLLGVGMLLWFYLTPIFYDPERISPEHARLLMLNPMTVIVQAHRAVVLQGELPNLAALALLGFGSAVLLLVSLKIFRSLEDLFVEEV